MMHLYELHDDAKQSEHPLDRTYAAIWANNPGEAIDYFVAELKRDYSQVTEEHIYWKMREVDSFPKKSSLHQENRDLVLRELGWFYEGDCSCTSCDLYEMDGLKPLCDRCDQCEDCCDCQENEEIL